MFNHLYYDIKHTHEDKNKDLYCAFECLNYIFNSNLTYDAQVYCHEKGIPIPSNKRILAYILEAHSDAYRYIGYRQREGLIPEKDILRRCGILVVPHYFLVSNNHSNLLEGIFSKTWWEDGGWNEELIKLPYAKKHPARAFPCSGTKSGKQRCIAIPIDYAFMSNETENGFLCLTDIIKKTKR